MVIDTVVSDTVVPDVVFASMPVTEPMLAMVPMSAMAPMLVTSPMLATASMSAAMSMGTLLIPSVPIVARVGSCCCLASRSDILLSSYTMEEIWSWAVSGIRGIA